MRRRLGSDNAAQYDKPIASTQGSTMGTVGLPAPTSWECSQEIPFNDGHHSAM